MSHLTVTTDSAARRHLLYEWDTRSIDQELEALDLSVPGASRRIVVEMSGQRTQDLALEPLSSYVSAAKQRWTAGAWWCRGVSLGLVARRLGIDWEPVHGTRIDG